MAGWSATEITQGLEGVLNLATAGCIDLGQASDFVTDGLSALGMSASQSNDFVDMLSATITKSNTGVSQMQGAFENVAPIAGTLGISMSDLSTTLGLMANQGVKAEKAGTALKNLLTNMSSPTEAMTKAIEKYNLQGAQKLITDGKLVEGIKEMKTQLEGLTASEKTSVITTIAGREALSGVSALLNSSTNDINSLKFAVDSSTKSSRAYAMSLGLIDEKTGEVKVDINNLTKEQQKAYDQWQNFNSIMEETTDTMTLVGGSTTDLGAIIARFGKDASSDKVNNVLDFFDKMENSSDKATKTMKKYGIELKKNEDGSINFGETLKDVAVKWDDLTDAQKKSLAKSLGFKGSIEDLNELFGNEGDKIEELVDVYKEMEGVSEHLAKSFDATLKGSILSLSSAIQERLLQVFDKIKPTIQGVVDTLKTFFDIWNGMSEKVEGSGFGKAIEWLAEQSKGWGEAIANGLSNAISSIDKFINGKSFDNILKIGTNIIQGICKGIDKSYKDGSLTRAIDGAIKKICKFVKDNAPAVEKAGKQIIDSIKTGIKNNQDNINSALDGIMGVINTWAQGSAELDSLCGTFASTLIDGFIEQIGIKAKGKATEFWNAVKSMFDITNVEFPPNTASDVIDKLFGFNEESKPPETTLGKIGKWIKDYFCGESFADEVDKAGQNTTNNLNKGMEKGKEGTKSVADSIGQLFGQSMVSAVQQAKGQLQTEFTAIQNSARTAFTGMANIVRNQFLNCTNIVRNQAVNMTNIVRNQALNMSNIFRNQFVNCTNIIRNQMVNCANIVRNQCVNMANIFRNQFISMRNVARNQMVNVSNIVRNQAISWSNVIRNQVTNARNSFTQQFMSMRSVARNQLVAISNIVRNQAVAWANIIRNQSANCRSAMTSNFNGLASVARAGMSNVLATVRSYMAQIRSAVSQQMTMNFKVNKTVTTTNVTKNVQEGMRSTMSAMNSNMMGVGSPNIMSASGLGTININTNNGGISGNLALEVPLYLDGREVARATASYTQDELAKLSKRKNRKRGE